MPTRGELQVSALRAPIPYEMNRIDERQFCAAGYCDEIVNNPLMEIATGESLCLQCFEQNNENDGLESVTYVTNPHRCILQQQELRNATVKPYSREYCASSTASARFAVEVVVKAVVPYS
jgi:hypothetical protein